MSNLQNIVEPTELECWYVIRTHPKQEVRAADNLSAGGIQTFNPKLKERRRNPYTGAPTYLVKSLFPNYIFARFVFSKELRKVSFTRGVEKVVSFNLNPTPVDDEIIDSIKSRIDKDGLLSFGEELKSGDKVVVNNGPLKDFVGIFEEEVNDKERVSILLTTVSYQARVVVERSLIKKVA